MYVTWQMLIGGFVAACVGFSSVCAAVVWIIKIVRGMKKPNEDTKDKLKEHEEQLANGTKNIKKVEENIEYIRKTQTKILECLLIIFDELKKNNDVDGVIHSAEKDLNSFLLDNR